MVILIKLRDCIEVACSSMKALMAKSIIVAVKVLPALIFSAEITGKLTEFNPSSFAYS